MSGRRYQGVTAADSPADRPHRVFDRPLPGVPLRQEATDPLPVAAQAGVLAVAHVREPRQHPAPDLRQILEDHQRAEGAPPLLIPEKGDGGVLGPSVGGEPEDEERRPGILDPAVRAVDPLWIAVVVPPVEGQPFPGYRIGEEGAQVLPEGGLDLLSRQDMADP